MRMKVDLYGFLKSHAWNYKQHQCHSAASDSTWFFSHLTLCNTDICTYTTLAKGPTTTLLTCVSYSYQSSRIFIYKERLYTPLFYSSQMTKLKSDTNMWKKGRHHRKTQSYDEFLVCKCNFWKSNPSCSCSWTFWFWKECPTTASRLQKTFKNMSKICCLIKIFKLKTWRHLRKGAFKNLF